MIYLAAPYAHPRTEVRQIRYQQVSLVASVLMERGHDVYSPITHGHALVSNGCSVDAKRWLSHGLTMLQACSQFAVLTLAGWERSEGVNCEINEASNAGLAVQYINYDEFIRNAS